MGISPRKLTEVLLKVSAVMLLVEAILSIPTVVGQLLGIGSDGNARAFRIVGVWTFLSVALTAIAGSWLLKSSEHLAARLVRDEPSEASGGSLERAAFAVLGIYFLVLGLRQAAGLAFQAATKPFGNEMLAYLWEGSGEAVVGAVVQIVAGLILLLGREGLTSGLSRLRGEPLP